MAMYTAQALAKVNQLGLKAQDYGWDGKFTNYAAQKIGNWTPQYLANALGEPVYTKGQDGADYVAAYPYGSRDAFSGAPVPSSGPTKETVIAQIQKLADDYALSSFGQSPTLPSQSALQAKAQEIYKAAQSFGITADEFNSTFKNYYNDRFPKYLASYKEQNDPRGGLLGVLDKISPIAANIGAGIITGGLSLPQQLAANALIGLSKGGSPEDIVRGIVGSLAAEQAVSVLKELNQQIVSAGPNIISKDIASALVNAERQAVNALATGQDVGRAALAGTVGGVVSSEGLLATDNAAIARAAGEYTQALAAGLTQDQALTKALSGFIASEQAAARQKVLDTASQGQTATQDKTGAIDQTTGAAGTEEGAVTSQGGDKSLAPVTVTATADPNQQILDLISTGQQPVDKTDISKLPEVTVTATADNTAGNLSTITATDTGTKDTSTGKAKTDTGIKDSILLSLLNQPLTTQYAGGGSQGPTQTQLTYGPGSQALAQALRIGDAGLPVFGGDKEKSKRSGWNVESLRYMGNSEV